MKIIPAIDIISGQCVRLSQGAYNSKKVYHTDPLEVAKNYEGHGLMHLHVVDLDGARAGRVVNIETLQKLTGGTSLIIDYGGGIKSDHDIEMVFEAGANQVTCGSIAVKDMALTTRWIEQYGGKRIILGADVKDKKIAISGWEETTDLEVEDLIHKYTSEGIDTVICTDIATDGMLQGPNIALYKELLQTFPSLKLIASGGVSNLTDLEHLQESGLYGVIIGKAIYENKISLTELARFQDA